MRNSSTQATSINSSYPHIIALAQQYQITKELKELSPNIQYSVLVINHHTKGENTYILTGREILRKFIEENEDPRKHVFFGGQYNGVTITKNGNTDPLFIYRGVVFVDSKDPLLAFPHKISEILTEDTQGLLH